jgi:hypothetical protein
MSVLDDARSAADDLVQLRRALHGEPELGLDLPRTQQRVLAALDGLPLEVTTGDSLTSVTAVLRGGAGDASDRAVLLRGDMDALPVHERTGVDYTATGDTTSCRRGASSSAATSCSCSSPARKGTTERGTWSRRVCSTRPAHGWTRRSRCT